MADSLVLILNFQASLVSLSWKSTNRTALTAGFDYGFADVHLVSPQNTRLRLQGCPGTARRIPGFRLRARHIARRRPGNRRCGLQSGGNRCYIIRYIATDFEVGSLHFPLQWTHFGPPAEC